MGWGRKSSSGPAETAFLSRLDFSQSNKHDTFLNVVSPGYFCVLFYEPLLFQIFVTWKFRPSLV